MYGEVKTEGRPTARMGAIVASVEVHKVGKRMNVLGALDARSPGC